MVDGKRGIEPRMRIVGTEPDVNGTPALCRSRKCLIVGFFTKIDVGRVESNVQHAYLKADAQLAFTDFLLIGILPPETLVAEQTDGFIENPTPAP